MILQWIEVVCFSLTVIGIVSALTLFMLAAFWDVDAKMEDSLNGWGVAAVCSAVIWTVLGKIVDWLG